VGVQIVAPYLHDRAAVRFAQLATGVIGEYEPPPGF
jgi:amidase